MAMRESLKYPGVDSVTLVELDPAMTKLFRHQPALVELNLGSLKSSKVRVANADAFKRLEDSPGVFDVIVADFPDTTNQHRQALHQLVLCLVGQTPGGERLCGDPDHLATGGAPQLLDGGDQHRMGMAHRHAEPRTSAEFW
ncbi:hypothetical protein M2244_000807 [Rhodoferax antarcticus]|nr:hypothetical protein [Rhodoferax antarcticus]